MFTVGDVRAFFEHCEDDARVAVPAGLAARLPVHLGDDRRGFVVEVRVSADRTGRIVLLRTVIVSLVVLVTVFVFVPGAGGDCGRTQRQRT